MAATVMTVEFCTSHHNSSLDGNAEAFSDQCVNCDILVKKNHVLNSNMNTD